MEKNNEGLPTGWEWAKISDISDVIRGASPRPKGDPRYFGGNIPWIMISDISKELGKFISKTRDHVTEEGSKKSRFLKKGSLILSNSGTVCVPKILAVDGCIHDGFVTFPELPNNIEILYAYFWFEYIRPRIINENRQGVTQVNLNTSIVKNIQIPLAPLNEQKRIVSKIEELLSKTDFSKLILEKTKILLKQNRQSLLNSALEGKLTRKWREENNVSVNFEKKSLENLILFSRNGFTGRPNENKKGIPRLGIETITGTDSIYINESKHKFIEITISKIERYRAKKGDLFVCRQNGNKNYVGKSAVFNDLIKPMIFSDSLIQIRPNMELVLPEYLAFFINSQHGRKQIEKFCSTTAGNYSVNGTNLKKTIIEFPSLLEQKQIIEKIDEGFSLIQYDEKIIDLLLRNIDSLRKSILKRAFEGKLVFQESNDESISILLEKIKQEKEDSQGKRFGIVENKK